MAGEGSDVEQGTGMAEMFAGSSSAVAAVQGVFGPAGGAAAAAMAAASVVGSGAPSGEWTFDREQLDAVIRKWEDLRDDLGKDRQSLYTVTGLNPSPSDDEPSYGYTRQVRDSLVSLQDSTQSMIAYIQDFVDRLVRARDGIEQSDSTNADSFRPVKGS